LESFPGNPASTADLRQPAKTVMFADSELQTNAGPYERFTITAPSHQKGYGDDVAYRHNGRAVAGFCDAMWLLIKKEVLERNSPIKDEFFWRW